MTDTFEQRLHETRLGLGRRIVEHIRNGGSDLAEGPMRNDVSVYLDPARHAAERQKLFRETPLVVCLSNDIKEPGSYRTFDETGVPILVVRGRDGEVRAFLNVCTHRGARLVRESEGKARLFTCWFHGWSYANDGKLAAAPEAERFCDALAERDHLVSVPAAERLGLVFVQATPGSTMDIDAHLGDFAPQLELLQLDKAERVKTGQLPVKANWKYALDTYGEGYHFAALHKQTLAPHFRNDITIYDRFGPHHRVLFVSRQMEEWLDRPEERWGVDHQLGGIHYIFPNTILFAGSVSPGKGYYTTFRHFPGETPGETITYKTIYAPKGVHSEEYRKEVEDAFDATAHVVTTEDYVVAAEGWRNLAALPKGSTVVYGRQELALQNQHRTIASAIGMPLPETAA
ncbi:MAG TPA: aromatic ring-hydroxylating dioxygenase subunit alpha [Caulobacteraceae bacterium]|nr:aromatic ring-hydroxylating dioxygenase subunit alpha [Caulobacteraceae bacterium]